jgi:UDP-N-acetylglucosamine 2-epimerase (non-hydrolysing)
MKKILFIFGTRPEAIKLFPLILESKKNLVSDIKLFCTGQHDKALEEIYEIFNTYPDLTLNLKRKNNSLSELSSLLLDNTNKAINKYKPDLVVVHGDTSSSFIGALNAFYNKIDIAHIEAGLRTGDVYSPFPEEINRSFISKIASYNFCPTNISKKNLIKEGLSSNKIYIVGNTVIDAVLSINKRIETNKVLSNSLQKKFNKPMSFKERILITIHRRENWGERLNEMLETFKHLAQINPDISFIFSVHPNPSLNKKIRASLKGFKNIFLLKPQNYISFVFLMKNVDLIYSDSGGIQEEATSLNKNVCILRDHTERPEVLATGLVFLVGTSRQGILEGMKNLSKPLESISYPFGKGDASKKIIKVLHKNGY